MILLIGALTLGLILALLALGVYVSFRIFNIPDMTAEGTVTLGASVAAVMMVDGYNPILATTAAALAGAVAGAITGLLATKCKINTLLSGILMMTGLYSVNLHVMGKSNVPMLETTTLSTYAEDFGMRIFGSTTNLNVAGWAVSVRDASILLSIFAIVTVTSLLLYLFFRTDLGTAMRATGDNPHMIRALGVSVDTATIFGLAISNGLVGLCGALIAQYQGFADVQMGIGMVVSASPASLLASRLWDKSCWVAHHRNCDGLGSIPSPGGYSPALGP